MDQIVLLFVRCYQLLTLGIGLTHVVLRTYASTINTRAERGHKCKHIYGEDRPHPFLKVVRLKLLFDPEESQRSMQKDNKFIKQRRNRNVELTP